MFCECDNGPRMNNISKIHKIDFSVSLPADLKAFWPLNNKYRLLDLSGHGTVMTKSGAVALGRGLRMEPGGSYTLPG